VNDKGVHRRRSSHEIDHLRDGEMVRVPIQGTMRDDECGPDASTTVCARSTRAVRVYGALE